MSAEGHGGGMSIDRETIKTIVTILGIVIGAIGGGTAVNANGQRDDAIERARDSVRKDIDWGYNMCRQKWIERVESGESDRVPRVPEKKIERLANEAVQDAVEDM